MRRPGRQIHRALGWIGLSLLVSALSWTPAMSATAPADASSSRGYATIPKPKQAKPRKHRRVPLRVLHFKTSTDRGQVTRPGETPPPTSLRDSK